MDGVTPRTFARGETLKLVWSGVFQGRKALPLVLEALGALSGRDWRLSVLGEGPEAPAWRAAAGKAGIEDRITWCGMQPRDKALEVMRDAHVLLHSSLKEGTPHVVLESLALGVPVICHDACGMGTAVTDACGIKIPMVSPQASIEASAKPCRPCWTSPGWSSAFRGARSRGRPGLAGRAISNATPRLMRRCWVTD